MKLIVPIIAISLTVLAAACSGKSTGAPTPGGSTTAPAPTATVEPDPSPTPAPTVTQIPLPTSTVESAQASDTESINEYLRGQSLLAQGEYEDAERQFNTVVKLEPGFAHGWDGIGQALLYQGEFEESMYYFDKAIELRPTLAAAYSHRSLARINLADLDGAERDALRAIKLNVETVDPYIVLGRVLTGRGELVDALANFDRAVELAPEDGGTYWWRGRFWRDGAQNYLLALDDFNRAIELEPSVASIFLDRAIVLIQIRANTSVIRADIEEAMSLAQEPRLPGIIARAEELLAYVDSLDAQAPTAGF
jgi:tetratricopeptide (TPR) repeat protein